MRGEGRGSEEHRVVGGDDRSDDRGCIRTSGSRTVPDGINAVPAGSTLQDMLVAGDLDAMMVPGRRPASMRRTAHRATDRGLP